MAVELQDRKISAIEDPLFRARCTVSGAQPWVEFWRERAITIPTSTTLNHDFLASLPLNSFVADIGCGPGRIVRYLSENQHRVVGIDVNRQALVYAHTLGRTMGYIAGDGMHLPLTTGRFDAAILMGVLGVAEEAKRTALIGEAKRVIRPGGYVYVSEFERVERDEVWRNVYQIDYQFTQEDGSVLVIDWQEQRVRFIAHHFRNRELVSLLTGAGLADIQTGVSPIVSTVGGRIYNDLCAWGK